MHFIGRRVVAAALLAGVSAPVYAADMPDPIIEVPAPVYGGWYLRGHIGMSNQRLDRLEADAFSGPTIMSHTWLDKGSFSSAPIMGVGVGYKFNDYLRGDIGVEYRGAADFNALDRVERTPGGPGNVYTNDYSGKKSEWLLLANAYADLGTFYGITPYVGAGLGASRNTISNFRDVNELFNGGGYANTTSKWNLAWALHAGIGIQATERMTIDLGYSYVNLGDAQTGTIYNFDPSYAPVSGITFKNIASHDLKLGVRYSLN
ncbi:outer membrane protein [Aminobacter sp. HY435]|uniref:outer membrane protein n=1 Tax=Aminobacter sp. HY435 TaxID=2970917 RepID=UPI0022B97D08|nr:outer membrane beta-barrel protein [Aminobacter sp. HY435]